MRAGVTFTCASAYPCTVTVTNSIGTIVAAWESRKLPDGMAGVTAMGHEPPHVNDPLAKLNEGGASAIANIINVAIDAPEVTTPGSEAPRGAYSGANNALGGLGSGSDGAMNIGRVTLTSSLDPNAADYTPDDTSTTGTDESAGTRERGPTHRTEFGVCEHDWVMAPCMKHRQCLTCSEHVCLKGDMQAHARIRERYEHHLAECTKTLDAVLAGTAVADRWLEHAIKSFVHEQQLLDLMESDEIEDGAPIRLADERAEHTHLSRALAQRLPQLRDAALPQSIAAIIRSYCGGKSLVDAAS